MSGGIGRRRLREMRGSIGLTQILAESCKVQILTSYRTLTKVKEIKEL